LYDFNFDEKRASFTPDAINRLIKRIGERDRVAFSALAPSHSVCEF
jgi:hypothetical protein